MHADEIKGIRELALKLSNIVSPTPEGDDNYWRKMINKAFDTPYELSALELFELGRFSERLVNVCPDDNPDDVLVILRMKRYMQSIISYSTSEDNKEPCGIIALPVRNGKNTLHMAFADCQATVTPAEPDEDGKQEDVGMVGGTMGGSYELNHRKKRAYFTATDAWNALCTFHNAVDDKIRKKEEKPKTEKNEQ